MNRNNFFKNPKRNLNPKVPPYVPQYQLLDIEPMPAMGSQPKFKEQKRDNIPFAEIPQRNVLPNIGQDNNWATIDNLVIDDDGNTNSIPQSKMIDNNNFYPDNQDTIPINGFLLLVKGEIILTGSLEEIESEAQKIMFNEHNNVQASYEDLMILKRVDLKVGVFIKE